jgi:hypothetical protein
LTTFVTRDADIRSVLVAELKQRFSDPSHDLILEEFGCKTARIDIAVVNGALHGFEIKSDSDSLARLAGQAEQYGRVFDFVTLICVEGYSLQPSGSFLIGGACDLPTATMEL